MFYFQELLQQGLAGIDGTAMIPSIIAVSYTILLISFLIGLYHAAARGGDMQALAVGGIKYLIIAILLANWSSVFREVNGSFNQLAQFIDNSSGAGDMFLSWFDQLKQQFADNGAAAVLPAITATFAAVTTALMILASYLIYAMMVVVFAFFYVLYGCVLYVVGPLVMALLPMAGVGQLAKVYATNLMIWNSWGVLYATFGSLITAIQFNRIDAVMNQGFLRGFFLGSSQETVIGLVSVFYALALGLIPFIAKKIIAGDVGSTAYSFLRAGTTAAAALASGINGISAGARPETGSATASNPGSSSAAPVSSGTLASSSVPPPQPALAETIRGGIMSAMGASAPPASSLGDNGAAPQSTPASTAPREAPGSSRPSSVLYRGSGLTQTLAFHTGRLAANLLHRAEPNRNKS